MSKTERKEKTEGTKTILKFLKAMFVSLIITFAAIIIFAFVIKWTSLPDSIIAPVNLVIKGVSVFFGALIFSLHSSKGFTKGIMFGLIYTLVSFVIFSLLAKSFSLSLGLIADFGFSIVVGAIGGILGVNKK